AAALRRAPDAAPARRPVRGREALARSGRRGCGEARSGRFQRTSLDAGRNRDYSGHMRIAAIDIGTNSIHMIVVQIRPDLSFEVIDREKEMVRLGAGGLDGRALTPEAMHAALQVLSKFRRLAESHKVDEVIAVATSATREAENGGEFLHTVTQQTGIRPRVISGTEEARPLHMSAVHGIRVPADAAVGIDIARRS